MCNCVSSSRGRALVLQLEGCWFKPTRVKVTRTEQDTQHQRLPVSWLLSCMVDTTVGVDEWVNGEAMLLWIKALYRCNPFSILSAFTLPFGESLKFTQIF